MSKAAALQPGGSDRMRATASLNVPHSVGKSSESMLEFTDEIDESFRGYNRS